MIKHVIWFLLVIYMILWLLRFTAESTKCTAKGGVLVPSFIRLVCVKELP